LQFQSLITTETDAKRLLLPRAKITGGIPLPMDLPRLVILKGPDRTSPGRESALMMKGAGQLAGTAAIAFFGNPANLHFEPEWEWKMTILAE
jgi:hypothetical protein